VFCEECGTKNENNAAFCEKCGHKMLETKINNSTIKKEKKQMTKKSKIIIGISFIVFALLIGSYIYLSSLCNPETVAKNYFKAYAANDAKTMYNILDLDNSTFVNKKTFVEKINNNNELKISNYKVKKVEKTDLITSVTITYVEEGSSFKKTIKINLTKNKNKKWLLFDKWTVDKSKYVTKDFEVYVPKGSSLKIDGNKIDKKYKTTEDSIFDSFDEYKIPEMLNFEYNLLVTLKSGIEVSSKMNVYGGSYPYYKLATVELSKKANETLEKDLNEKIQSFYTAALENKSFEDIKDSYSEDAQTDIEEDFNEMKSAMNNEDEKITKMELTELKISDVTIGNDGIDIDANIKYKYTVSYKEDNKTKTFDSEEVDDKVYLTYSFVNDKLVISDLFGLDNYYTNY